MSRSTDELLNAVLQLSEADRIKIAGRLLESFPEQTPGLPDEDPEFSKEIRRRVGDMEGAIPWEQLRRDLRQTP